MAVVEPWHSVTGWRCAVCGTDVSLAETEPWRCPRSTATDRNHLLQHVLDPMAAGQPRRHPNPFVRYDSRLAWSAAAATRGMPLDARDALVIELDRRVREVDRIGFASTPFERHDALSAALGFNESAGVWVKRECDGVAGSQKSRHLVTILLFLLADEMLAGRKATERPPLAIASCGNAALAAATLASAADWPLDVYVPTWMDAAFGRELDRLGARTRLCERRADDPPGDPAMFRFREAVANGAIPFTVQGPENVLCLDGGRSIGWEIAEQFAEAQRGDDSLDAVFVQVGGGAFASSVAAGLSEVGHPGPLMAVQTAGCAPLARAWERGATVDSVWSEVMTPWPDPASIADGILDDETYDWIGVVGAMRQTGGQPVVALETSIEQAWHLARRVGLNVSPTGAAGLAGLLATLDGVDGAAWRARQVAIVASGVQRGQSTS